ncbi:MAG: fatty-acyl-CoA synthase [Motiliproteus sp.]|jgi:fatty-acyl-CoA synthase
MAMTNNNYNNNNKNSSSGDPYSIGLEQNTANFVPLSPVGFIARTAEVYPEHTAIIYGELRRNWAETYARCLKIAAALQRLGIGPSDTVAAILPNIPEMLELHFAVPMLGAVLNAQNTRLDAEAIAFMLDHAGAKVLVTDKEFSATVSAALALCKTRPLVIDVDDPLASGRLLGEHRYEQLLQQQENADFNWQLPVDEWHPITLNYTSGTTGNPKGVVYHHRGAYLNAMSNIIGQELPRHAVYLWTLPMFHCNGWCYPWAVTAVAGTHVCLRQVTAEPIFAAIKAHRVSHFCGAPVVLNMLINAPEEQQLPIEHPVTVTVGGAAPPATVIEGMQRLGIQVVHAYGLTETYGPSVFCDPQQSWTSLSFEEQAAKMARQGVQAPGVAGLQVADSLTGQPVVNDGLALGEVMIRSNTLMKGYLANPKATAEAFQDGWFRTGDIAVRHPDGYIEVKDRSKDVIISGGENISTIEVEAVLYRHSAVLEAAVVAKADPHWGEVPCAIITLKAGMDADAQQLIDFCRDRLAHYKCPKQVLFAALPKTSTGKIQKFALRALVNDSA